MDAHREVWPPQRSLSAVLFDRDGTLVDDVPYNGDPERMVVRPSARCAVDRLRALGLRICMVTNQSGVSRGIIARDDVDRVNERLADMLGGLDVVMVCPHAPTDRCGCRKPEPGMITEACAQLSLSPEDCCLIGDSDSDMEAASRAGCDALRARTDRELVRAVDRVVQWA